MNKTSHPFTALTWAPDGKRSRGRPKETWRRTVEKEREELGFSSWGAARTAAGDKARWRTLTDGPIFLAERRK